MRILVIGSINNHGGQLAPFITEQADALGAAGCEVAYYGVTGKGVRGYLRGLKDLRLKDLRLKDLRLKDLRLKFED